MRSSKRSSGKAFLQAKAFAADVESYSTATDRANRGHLLRRFRDRRQAWPALFDPHHRYLGVGSGACRGLMDSIVTGGWNSGGIVVGALSFRADWHAPTYH